MLIYKIRQYSEFINSLLCEDSYLIQANHVAETSVLSGDQVSW